MKKIKQKPRSKTITMPQDVVPKKRQRMPEKEPKSGFFKEWAIKTDLFCDQLGMDDNELTRSNMEAIRCKGRDHKEAQMVRRIWARETDWQDEGYFIDFYEVTSLTMKLIVRVGPFESEGDTIRAYNTVINHYGFSKSLLIHDPDEPEVEEDEWGEPIGTDDMDWGDDEWGEDEDPDDLDWGEDDGWT